MTADDWPVPVSAVFNPGAATDGDETVLLCRVEDQRGISHLTVARSTDGIGDWRIEPIPLIADGPDDPNGHLGTEDPRITRIEELDGWCIAYTLCTREGPSVALAFTHDFQKAEQHGVILSPDDKNAVLLPRRVGGQYVLFHRPKAPYTGAANIWLSRSSDLASWSAPQQILAARAWPWWDSARVGLGTPPIETPVGWLSLYHGVKNQVNGVIYRAGLVLFDLDEPERVLRRGEGWVLSPTEPYEVAGNTPNVVFPTGLIHDRGTDELRMYYGAADTCIGLATARLDAVLDYLLSQPEPVRA